MPQNLIHKYQLDSDFNDLVSGYGINFFTTLQNTGNLGVFIQNLLSSGVSYVNNIYKYIYINGNAVNTGVQNNIDNINNINILSSTGIYLNIPNQQLNTSNSVNFNSGNFNSGFFLNRPLVSGVGVITNNYDYMNNFNSQTINGIKTFNNNTNFNNDLVISNNFLIVNKSGNFNKNIFSKGSPVIYGNISGITNMLLLTGIPSEIISSNKRVSGIYSGSNLLWSYNISSGYQDYINRVESADGQVLERNVKLAMGEFISGCFQDGNWFNMQSACLLCGPKTINGALSRLGIMSISNNGITDYIRASGLGNLDFGNDTPYLDTRFSVLNQDSTGRHLAIYINNPPSSPISTISGTFIGENINAGRTELSWITGAGNGLRVRVGSNSSSYPFGTGYFPSGFLGVSRISSSQIRTKLTGLAVISNQTLVNPDTNMSLFILNRNNSNGQGNFSLKDTRITFYSVGDAIDLDKLENRVNNYMYTIRGAISGYGFNSSTVTAGQTLNIVGNATGFNYTDFNISIPQNTTTGCKVINTLTSPIILTIKGSVTDDFIVNGSTLFTAANFTFQTGMAANQTVFVSGRRGGTAGNGSLACQIRVNTP